MLSSRARNIQESSTLKMKELADQLRAQGKKVISLDAGEPDFPAPKEAKEAAIRAVNEDFSHYTAVAGIRELREAIAEKLTKDNRIPTDWKQVVVTNGGKQAIHNCLMVLADK